MGGQIAVHQNLEDHLQQMQMNKLKPIQLQHQNRRAQTQAQKVRPNKKADINSRNQAAASGNSTATTKMLTLQAPQDDPKRQSPKSGFVFQQGIKTDSNTDVHEQIPTSMTTNSINYLSTAFQKPHLKPIHQPGPAANIIHSEIEDCDSPTQEEETLVVNTERNSKEVIKDADYEVLFKNALQNQIQEVERRSSRLQHNRPNNIDETQPSFLFGWQQNAQQYIEQSAPNKLIPYPGADARHYMAHDPRATAGKQIKVDYKFDHFRVTGASAAAESKSTRMKNRRNIKALDYMKQQQEVEHIRIQGSPQEGAVVQNSAEDITDDNKDHASTLRRQQKRFSQTGHNGIQRIHYELTYDRSKSSTAEQKRIKTRQQSSFMNKMQSLRHGRPDVRSSHARRAAQKHTGDNSSVRNQDLAQIVSNQRLTNAANTNRSNNQNPKGSNRTPRQNMCVTKQVSTLNNSGSPAFQQKNHPDFPAKLVYQAKNESSKMIQTPNSRNWEEVERDVASTLKKDQRGSIEVGEGEPKLGQCSKITEMPKDEGGSVILGESPVATEGDYRYDNEIDLLRKDSQMPATKGNSERHSQDEMLNSDIPQGAILQSRRPTLEIEGTPPHEGLVPVEQLLWKDGPAPIPTCLMSQTPESSNVMKTAKGHGLIEDTILSASSGLRGEPHVKSSRLDNIIRDSINQKMAPSSRRVPRATQSNGHVVTNTPALSNRQNIVLAKPTPNNESIQNLATDLKIEGKYHVAGSQFQQDGTLVVRINSQEESERQKQFQTLQQDYAANQSQSSPLNRQIYGDAQRAQYLSQPMHPSHLQGNAIQLNVRQQYGYGNENEQQPSLPDEPAEDLHFTLCNQVVKRRKQMVHYNKKYDQPQLAQEDERPQLQFKGKQQEILNIRTTGNVNLNPIQKNLNKKRAKTPQMAKFLPKDQIDKPDLHYQFLQNFESKKDAYLQNYYQSQKRVQLRNHLMLLRQRALESQHQKTQEQYLQSLAEAIASTNGNSQMMNGPSRVHKAQTPVTLAYNSAVNIKNFEEVERLQKTLKMDVKSSPKAQNYAQSQSLVPINININKNRGSTPSGPVHVPQYDRVQTNIDRLYKNRLIQESQRASNASSTMQHENDDKEGENNLQINSKNFIHSTRDGRSRDYGSGMEHQHPHHRTQHTAETKGSARFSNLNPSQLSKRSKPSQHTGRSNDEKAQPTNQKIPVIGLNLGETSNQFEASKNLPKGGIDPAELQRRIDAQQEQSIHIPDVAPNVKQSPTQEAIKSPSQIRMSPELEQKLLNHLSSQGLDNDTKQTIILVDQDFNVINDQDLQINQIQFMNPQFQGIDGAKVYENLDYIQQHYDQLQTISGHSNAQTKQCLSPPQVNGGGGTREPTVGGVSSFISVKSIKTIKSASGMDSAKLGHMKIQTRSQQSVNSRAHSGSASTIGDASNIQKMGMRNAPGVFQGSEHSLNFLGSKSKLRSPSRANDYKLDSPQPRRPETQGAQRKDAKKVKKSVSPNYNREDTKSAEDDKQLKKGLTIDVQNVDHFLNQQSQGIDSYGRSNETGSKYHHNGREVKIRHIQLQKFPKNSQAYDRQGSVKSHVNRIQATELPREQIFFEDNSYSKGDENQLVLSDNKKINLNAKDKFESARPQYSGMPVSTHQSKFQMRTLKNQTGFPNMKQSSSGFQPFELIGVKMGSNQMEAQQMIMAQQSSRITSAFDNNVRIATKSTPKEQNCQDSVSLINGLILHQVQTGNNSRSKAGTYRQKRATSQHSRTRSLKSKISTGQFITNANHMSQYPSNLAPSPAENGLNTLEDKWQHKNMLMQQLNDIHMNLVPADSRDRQQRVYRQQVEAHEKIAYQKYLQKVGLTDKQMKQDAAISGDQFKYDLKMSKDQIVSDGSNSMAGAKIIQPLLDQKLEWIINQKEQSPKALALTMQQTTLLNDHARQKMMFETNAGSQFNKYSTLEGPSQERAHETSISPNRQNEIIEETKVACSSRQDNIVDSYVQKTYADIEDSFYAKLNQNREYQRSLRKQINELKGQQPLQAQNFQFPNQRDTVATASALSQQQDQSKSPKRHQRSFRKRSRNHQSNSRSASKTRKDYQISKSPKLCGDNLNQNREYVKNKDGQMILIPQLPVKALVVVGKKKRGSKILGNKQQSPQNSKQSRQDTTQSPRRTTENDDLQIVQIINPAHLKTCGSPASGQTGTLHMNSQKMSIQNILNQGKNVADSPDAGLNIETSYFPVLQLRNGQIVSGEIRSGHLSQQMVIEQAIKQQQNANANTNLGPLIHIQTLNLESLDSVSPAGQTGRSTLRPVSDSRNNGRLHSNSRKKAHTQATQIRFSQDKTSKSGRSSPVKQQTTSFLTKPQAKPKVNKFHGGVDLSKEQRIVQNDANGYSPPVLQDNDSQPETPRTNSVTTSPNQQVQTTQMRKRQQRNSSEKE